MEGIAICCVQMMSFTDARELCISHDAILCDTYGGNWYLLYTNDVLNFSDARELCV